MIAQAAFEFRLLMRNGEQLLLTIVIPVALLIGTTLVAAVPLDEPPGVARIPLTLGGVIAVAIIASAFTSLAISVGFDRRSGGLVMLATTPLSRGGILGARAVAAMAVIAVQTALLIITALVIGWRPPLSGWALLPVALMGAGCFAALGFALGGAVRAEATLAIANAVFIALVAVGGTTFPASSLPQPLSTVVSALPSSALADMLRWTTGATAGDLGTLLIDVAIVAAWGLLGVAIAARTFRWR